MIHYVSGDIFLSKADAIVNPVNCVGVMGAGLAKQFKHYCNDEMFIRYKKLCDARKLRPGVLHYYQMAGVKPSAKLVINFPTKDHWRDKSEMDYVESGLRNFRNNYEKRGITSVAFPPLGCGLGGLKWSDVKSIMEQYLSDLPIDVYIYAPKG